MRKEKRTEFDVLMEASENGISVTERYHSDGYETITLTKYLSGRKIRMVRKIPGRSWTLEGDCVPKWFSQTNYKAQYLKAMEMAISVLVQ